MQSERFVLKKSERSGYYVCTDTVNKIVCVFRERNFNGDQSFSALEDFDVNNASIIATYVREMGDWLRENHYEKLF